MKKVYPPPPFGWLYRAIEEITTRRKRRRQKLSRIPSRDKPLGPTLGIHKSRLSALDGRTVQAARERQSRCPLFARLPLEIRLHIYELLLGDRTIFIDHQYSKALRREKPSYHPVCFGTTCSDRKAVYGSENCFAHSSVWPVLKHVSAHIEVPGRQQRCGLLSALLCCKAVYVLSHLDVKAVQRLILREYSVIRKRDRFFTPRILLPFGTHMQSCTGRCDCQEYTEMRCEGYTYT